jgi:hypothetical protein
MTRRDPENALLLDRLKCRRGLSSLFPPPGPILLLLPLQQHQQMKSVATKQNVPAAVAATATIRF